MNPVVLGAIIGTVPGTLAAALAMWASIRAANVNIEQIQLAVAVEHAQWLRDKRSEVYVDLLAHAEQLFTRRHAIVNRLGDITDEDRGKVQEIVDECGRAEDKKLTARGDTYAPSDTAETFGGMVCLMDLAFWIVILAKVNETRQAPFEIDAEVKRIWTHADSGLENLRKLAQRDLQTSPLPSALLKRIPVFGTYFAERQIKESGR